MQKLYKLFSKDKYIIERFKNWMKSIIQDDEKTFNKLLNLGINFNLMNEKKIIEKSIRNIKIELRCFFPVIWVRDC